MSLGRSAVFGPLFAEDVGRDVQPCRHQGRELAACTGSTGTTTVPVWYDAAFGMWTSMDCSVQEV